MRVLFVRHAAAVERSPAVPEEMRYLTPEGRADFRRNAKRLAKEGVAPAAIFSSPLTRAVQTAEILAAAFRHEGELVVTPLLAPGFDPARLERLVELADAEGAEEIALVGHQPDLSLAFAAVAGIASGVGFAKGEAAMMELAPSRPRRGKALWSTRHGRPQPF